MSFVSATASNLSAVFIAAARILLAAAALLVNAAVTGYHVTAYVLSIVLAIVAWPLRAVYGVLFVVFSPIIYTVAYLLTPLFFFYNLVTSLQPLYIYLGSAAFVGVLAGLLIKATSTATIAALGIIIAQGTPSYTDDDERRRARPGLARTDSNLTSASETTTAGGGTAPFSGDGGRPLRADKQLEDSVREDWLWLESVSALQTADPTGKRKKKAAGLLSQTILEEESEGSR
ncbi:uncharacterized protein E0L32_004711 [Thyridium curvatum]|uniref:Transmembrane protein n=1 Tax=Thyridium curvatum TaxID=1093900 RepID=A0A507B5R6_9PEZI|nr:uncharacterized protein E0L32_004711 [Thyridium curvatum]TPX15153.1 hypothetical protein E0L32_004711 [Thyridium curvatum]